MMLSRMSIINYFYRLLREPKRSIWTYMYILVLYISTSPSGSLSVAQGMSYSSSGCVVARYVVSFWQYRLHISFCLFHQYRRKSPVFPCKHTCVWSGGHLCYHGVSPSQIHIYISWDLKRLRASVKLSIPNTITRSTIRVSLRNTTNNTISTNNVNPHTLFS